MVQVRVHERAQDTKSLTLAFLQVFTLQQLTPALQLGYALTVTRYGFGTPTVSFHDTPVTVLQTVLKA